MKNSQRGNLQPRSFHMEHLEQRHLLSAVPFGAGALHAATGTLNDADEGTVIQVTLNSSNAKAGASAIVQIRVEAADGSALDPGAMQLVDAENGEILFSHLNFEGTNSYALAKLVLNQEYELLVMSEDGTTGDYNIYVQLAGDTNGDSIVSEVEWRSVEAAVLQSSGFSSGLAKSWALAYGIDLYKNDYFNADFDTNGNKRVDASELAKYVTPNYYLTTQDGVRIDGMDIVTDSAAPQLSGVVIENSAGESVDTPLGTLGAWDGPWDEDQYTDCVTSAEVNAADGFIITGKIADSSPIASANGAFTFGSQTVEIADMLQNQGDYYTFDADTGVFTLDVGKALGIATGTFAEGDYVLEMWAADIYGNKHTDDEPSTITVTIDRVAPVFTPEIVADAVQKTVPTRLNFDKTQAVAGDYVQIWRSGDSGRVLLGTAILTAEDIDNGYVIVSIADEVIAAIDDGEYTFYARSIDLAGNSNEANVSQKTVVIDTEAPVITADLGHEAITKDRPADPSSSVEYTLDGEVNLTITATDDTALTYTLFHNDQETVFTYNTAEGKFESVPLVYGLNEFYVVITDAAGNSVTSGSVKLQKNDAPTVVEGNRITSHTQSVQNTNTWTVNLADTPLFADVNVDGTATGDVLTFAGTVLSGNAVESVTFDGTTLTVVFKTLGDDDIRFEGKIQLTATDKDGEFEKMDIDVVYTKDDVAPAVVDIELAPGGFRDDADNNTYYTPGTDGNFIIKGEIYDVSEIIEIKGELIYNGVEYDVSDLLSTTSGDLVEINVLEVLNAAGLGLTELADGEYELKIWGVDSVGNKSTKEDPSVAYTFVLDTVAPGVVVDSLSTPLYTNSKTPEITIQLDTTDSDLSGFWVEIRGTGPTPVYAVIPASAFTGGEYKFTPDIELADGAYVFTARTIDAAGNATAYCSEEDVIVDTIAPVIEDYELSAAINDDFDEPNYTNDVITDIKISASDVNSVRYILYKDSVSDGNKLGDTVSCISDMDYTFDDIELHFGANVFIVVLIDEAGNQSEPLTFTITQNTAPTIIGGNIDDRTISATETDTMTIDVSDFFNDIDLAAGDELTYTVAVDNTDNILTSWNYDAETFTLTLVFAPLADGANRSEVPVTITATDSYLEFVEGEFNAIYSKGNTAPKWKNNDPLETGMFYDGQTEKSLNFDFADLVTDDGLFSELEFDNIEILFGGKTYTVGTDTENNIIHNGGTSYTWTPPADYYGGGTLSVKVTDKGLEDGEGDNAPKFAELEKAILIAWENYAPELTLETGAVPVADINDMEEDSLRIGLDRDGSIDLTDYFTPSDKVSIHSTSGPDAPQALTWQIAGDVAGVSINEETGVLSYDFPTTDWGVKTISVTVFDGEDSSNTMTFTFNVYAVNSEPTVDPASLSFQVTGDEVQTMRLLPVGAKDPVDTWQDIFIASVTINGTTIADGESKEISVTHDGNPYTLKFSLSGNVLELEVLGTVDLTELEGLQITFSCVVQDDGTLPDGYTLGHWTNGDSDGDPATANVSNNVIQFNAYAKDLTYNNFVANSHANDYHGPITDILTLNEGNWGDKTFELKPGVYAIKDQDGNTDPAWKAVVADGTLEIQLPGNAFGQYTLEYTLEEVGGSASASATITLNVKATNAEAPVFVGTIADLQKSVDEGGELSISLEYLNSLFSDYETPGQFKFDFEYTDDDPAGIIYFEYDEGTQSYIFTPEDGLWGAVIGFKIIVTDTAFGGTGTSKSYTQDGGTITVNPVAVAPTVETGSVTIIDGKAVTVDLNNLITDAPVDGVTYTFDVPDTITGGTLERLSEGVYKFTPDSGYVGATGFEFSVTATKSKGDFTDSATTAGCQQDIIVAGTVHVTDKSLEVVVDSSSKSYTRNETLTDSIYLDGTNSVSGLITINAGSKLLVGTTFTLSSSNYSEDEIAEMMQGLLYTRNGDVFTITAECTVVNDWGLETRSSTFVDGVQFSAGTTFGAATTLNIKTYSLNTELYANPDAYLVMTDDSLTGVTAVNYTLKENSFIDRIEVVDGQLVIHYNVYSPTQDRTAQNITVTIAGVSEPVPVQITIDYVQPLQYYVRVVKESDYVSSDDDGYKTSELYAQNSINVAPGEKIYVEVWFQNDLPIITSLLYSQYKTWKQDDFLGLMATQLAGINFDDMVFSYPNGGYAGEYSTWSQDRDVTETENGFFAGDMASMIILNLIEVLGSGSDGTYARIGVLGIQLPEGQEGEITFKPFTDGSVDYNTSLQIFAKDGIEDSAGLELMNGWYNQNQVKHHSFTVTVTNGAKIYGTESARETVVEGTGVYMTVSKDKITDTQVAELPANEQWLTEWDSYYVNLWVNTQDPNVNLESLLFDLAYNANYITATGVEYTTAINGLDVMYSADGAVIGIGGTLLADLTNEDGFILIGRVKMESLAGDNVAADTVGSVKTGLALDNIQLKDKTGEAVTPNTQVYVNTNVFAVVYDTNDDGKIDIYDLIVFAKNYGDSSVDSLNPVTWALDFDNSGRIDIYDLIQFAKNYGAGQGGSQTVVYPDGFMQQWIGSQFLTEGDASVSEMLEVVVRQWQDALGEEFDLDVQIIVKDIGDSTLGESVLVSLDDAGKPAVAVIYLDASALGLGWYVSEDATQLADSGRYDLYTVLAHELGHALGFNPMYTGFTDALDGNGQWYIAADGSVYAMMSGSDHLLIEDDLMYYQIAPGVRKEISTLDAEIVAKARENGGTLTYVEKLTILGETSADVMTVEVASAIVDEAQWTQTLQAKVVAEIQREAQQLTAAAILAVEDDAPAVTPAAEADALGWLELSAPAAPVVVESAEAAADLLMGEWESFLEDSENGEDADDLPLSLDAE